MSRVSCAAQQGGTLRHRRHYLTGDACQQAARVIACATFASRQASLAHATRAH